MPSRRSNLKLSRRYLFLLRQPPLPSASLSPSPLLSLSFPSPFPLLSFPFPSPSVFTVKSVIPQDSATPHAGSRIPHRSTLQASETCDFAFTGPAHSPICTPQLNGWNHWFFARTDPVQVPVR
ncbi:hypothetical protein EX30DRAFT_344939 [Ascodesmis nigricans]|uniref:Uncharacterized protein n=1 Tax=Ascodesmis nigricans TaxID=341454 RepID=A0A4S2MI29_9PEZI|nr:hypothetical protein EX30DRAFT_344939 [Ascodesmis nigricans]